jgi:hypothetical protein
MFAKARVREFAKVSGGGAGRSFLRMSAKFITSAETSSFGSLAIRMFAAPALALNHAEMCARCRTFFVLRRRQFWHRPGVAFVVEALIGMIDRDASRERAGRRYGILDDDDLQAERAKDRFEAGGPHALFARDAVISAEQFCSIASGQACQPIDFQPTESQLIRALPARFDEAPVAFDRPRDACRNG